MTIDKAKMIAVTEAYFAETRRIRESGGATDELSFHPPMGTLLNTVGSILKPKIFAVNELKNLGAGHPDFGLYTSNQTSKGSKINSRSTPARGVVEMKPPSRDAWVTAESGQVSDYWDLYRLVLVTNTRDFVLLGEDKSGQPVKLETLRLADSKEDFAQRLATPRVFAREVGPRLCEFLFRAISHQSSITEPSDLAWLIASYAREALARVENADSSASLDPLKQALEETLGVQFQGESGTAFFRTTLVQTLFYGVFSAWVLWARKTPADSEHFDWRTAMWHLRSPVLKSLFVQLSDPAQLEPLDLVELLDWTGSALNRVNRNVFFTKFNDSEAIQYFYEPFLQEFDPVLRKRLGVWYTPNELVKYMVDRVDKSLKEDLGIREGLASERVYVLDPCCGTGAFLAEVLKRIADNLNEQAYGALVGRKLRTAASKRVFGFEVMPAPFVIANMQVELALDSLDASPANDEDEPPSVFLTNALTGWEPADRQPVPFHALEEERERADRVKQDEPILVIIGNPPYNGFAEIAVKDERELTDAYRTTARAPKPTGQGLNDLYVRFFRMAERRIAEKTGHGVICYVSNYSWLDALSFTGMREHLLDAFDRIRIDNLHGNRNISEYAPNGESSDTIFAIRGKSTGIKVGVSVALFSKNETSQHSKPFIWYRDFHQANALDRRRALLKAIDEPDIDFGYTELDPDVRLGFPLKPAPVADNWFDWPTLPEIFPTFFPGVKTSRDRFLIDIDLERLKERVDDYFNPALTHEQIRRRYPDALKNSTSFAINDARKVRENLVARGGPQENGFIKYEYRPFDTRWIYWDVGRGLLSRPIARFKPNVFDGNLWVEARQRYAEEDFSRGTFVRNLADNFGNGLSHFYPAWLTENVLQDEEANPARQPNLSLAARNYLQRLGLNVEDLFYYVLYVMHAPEYRDQNAGALRMSWPRIPLPGWSSSVGPAIADSVKAVSSKGRRLAQLMEPDGLVDGVTAGDLRSEFADIGVPTVYHGGNMSGTDFEVTAGWGHRSGASAVVADSGKLVTRYFNNEERNALNRVFQLLEPGTNDVYLNERAYWRNVPDAVWNYKLGGYPVLRKWLSYRERRVLERSLNEDEVLYFAQMCRRIAAILELTAAQTLKELLLLK